jgi:acetyl/propionyl-CoA carboxylase alpha subunit
VSRRLSLRWAGKHVEAEVAFRDGRVALTREGRAADAAYRREDGRITLTAGAASRVATAAKDSRGLWISSRGRTWLLLPEGRDGMARGAADAPDEIRAPMTGRVVSVTAAAGGKAKEGDLLLTIEAMKMEFKLTAPEDGTLLEVACAEGDRVELGQLLVRLEPDAPGEGAA